jgi:RND family efflux transporter MFP subunit
MAGLVSLSAATFDGLVLPFREVTISSPVEARIEALEAREGDSVQAGDLLVRLYADMEKLEAKRAAAAVEERAFEFKSSQNLFEEKVISEDEALESRIELNLATLTLEMAQEQVNLRQLKAPISGIVVERLVEVGEMVRPSEPILELIDLQQVYVQFYISSEDLSEVQVGRRVEVQFPSLRGESARVGTVHFIDPRVDAASGLLRARILLENPEGAIKAGLRTQVHLLESVDAAGDGARDTAGSSL